MNNNKLSQAARVNRTAVNLYTTIALILAAAYVLQVVKGETTPALFGVLMATLLLPHIAT